MNLDELAIGSWTRRKFLQVSAASAAASSLPQLAEAEATTAPGSMIGVAYEKRNPRIGVIGTGARGTGLVSNFLAVNAQIVALCDIVREKAEHAASLVRASGEKSPDLYTKGPHDYESMLNRKDVDFIVIATPWSWHAEMAIAAMKHGKDVGVEVPGVLTIQDCWKIVHTSEETRKHCTMMENACYGYNETLILRLVHDGVFGDLLYGEGAYLHDLRELLFANESEGLWRRAEHTKRNGNLYPTHGLGPVANYMDIQRGDRFAYIVSMSSPERSLDEYRKKHLQPGDPRLAERYITGDMNTSLIKTAKGLTITVKHSVSTPHPYDRINLIAGTKGLFEDFPPRIYVDGAAKEDWGSLDAWKKYQHPLWAKLGDTARKFGSHDGIDYIMAYRFLQCMREGLAPDMDVYDAAAWAAVQPLSVASVGHGSAPIEFPDFTRGKWQHRAISGIATQG